MKPTMLKQLVSGAKVRAGALSILVHDCLDGETVNTELLPLAITAAGYTIVYTDKANGAWARVYGEGEILLAQGYAADRTEALLHAAFGAVREEVATKAVGEALESAGLSVTPELRQKMESRYILEGGRAILEQDIAQMIQLKR